MTPLPAPDITYEVDLSRSWWERIPHRFLMPGVAVACAAYLIALTFATLPGSEPRSNNLLLSHTGDMKDKNS